MSLPPWEIVSRHLIQASSKYRSPLMQAVDATQVALDVELSTPMGPRQTQRTKDHMIAVLTDSRDLAAANVLDSMTAVTRIRLGFPAALRKYLRDRIKANRHRKALARALAHPLISLYVLHLRARAASRHISRSRAQASLDLHPPRLDRALSIDNLADRTPWLVLHDDSDRGMILYHRHTGATRVAPWIALRTSSGRVYFANLVTRATRWLPPSCWHSGWISYTSPFDARAHSHYTRVLLPVSLARVQIEGGAPFVHPIEAARRYLDLRIGSRG